MQGLTLESYVAEMEKIGEQEFSEIYRPKTVIIVNRRIKPDQRKDKNDKPWQTSRLNRDDLYGVWDQTTNALVYTISNSTPTYICREAGMGFDSIIIDDPAVSMLHASISPRINHTTYYIKDHNSKIGVYADGKRLNPNEEFELQNGQTVYLGPGVRAPASLEFRTGQGFVDLVKNLTS